MSVRKYNAVERLCSTARYPQTFAAILGALAATVNLKAYTAAQVAEMVDFAAAQHRHGYEQAMNELL